jgi:hypothetical protein
VYEFTDTLIMILKKNDRQISFLHVYHHASTFFPCWWAAINFAPGGDVWFICALNSFVHVCMYGYYLLAASGIKVSASVKKSITTLQMVQFGLLNLQTLYGAFGPHNYRPRIVVVLALIQSVVFMSLFYSFYRWDSLQTMPLPLSPLIVTSRCTSNRFCHMSLCQRKLKLPGYTSSSAHFCHLLRPNFAVSCILKLSTLFTESPYVQKHHHVHLMWYMSFLNWWTCTKSLDDNLPTLSPSLQHPMFISL